MQSSGAYLKIGASGIIGGSGLGIAMISFIYSITNTTAAITLLCLAAMPFFTALLAFIFFEFFINTNDMFFNILTFKIWYIMFSEGINVR